jgi:hypothetical protein
MLLAELPDWIATIPDVGRLQVEMWRHGVDPAAVSFSRLM